MWLSAAQILFGFIYEVMKLFAKVANEDGVSTLLLSQRHTLDPSYQKFLELHGGKPTSVIYTIRNLHLGRPVDVPALRKV